MHAQTFFRGVIKITDKNENMRGGPASHIDQGRHSRFTVRVLQRPGMAVCDYASLVTLIQPIQNATFFGKNVPKIIFAIMGGSKYFSDLFRPQFSEHVAQFQHSGAPSEYCLCSRCVRDRSLFMEGGRGIFSFLNF